MLVLLLLLWLRELLIRHATAATAIVRAAVGEVTRLWILQ